jgi:hypothetical protein
MTPFSAVAVAHGGPATDAPATECRYQGVFIGGHQPLWLVAHRGTYRVHEMDVREATGGAAQDAVPVAAMCGWRRAGARGGFVVVTGGEGGCELRFCRMPGNVRSTHFSLSAC